METTGVEGTVTLPHRGCQIEPGFAQDLNRRGSVCDSLDDNGPVHHRSSGLVPFSDGQYVPYPYSIYGSFQLRSTVTVLPEATSRKTLTALVAFKAQIWRLRDWP